MATAGEFGAIGEAIVFLSYFKDFPDSRQSGKVIYPFAEVLLLCLLAVLGGAETFVDIARFGEKKIGLLRRFRPFRDGTPSHDHLGDIFATLDAEEFQRRFVAWVAALTGAPKDVIAIDGLPAQYRRENLGSRYARMSRSSLPSRRPTALRIPRSVAIRRSTAITAASKPEPIPQSMMWLGLWNATIGLDCAASSWSRARAKSGIRSSARRAFTSPPWCCWRPRSGRSSAATGRSKIASTGSWT